MVSAGERLLTASDIQITSPFPNLHLKCISIHANANEVITCEMSYYVDYENMEEVMRALRENRSFMEWSMQDSNDGPRILTVKSPLVVPSETKFPMKALVKRKAP